MSTNPYVLPLEQRSRLENWLKLGLIKGFKEPFDKGKTHKFQLEESYSHKPIYEFLKELNSEFPNYPTEERARMIKQESKKIESFWDFTLRTLNAYKNSSQTLQDIDEIWLKNFLFENKWKYVKPVDYMIKNIEKLQL